MNLAVLLADAAAKNDLEIVVLVLAAIAILVWLVRR